MYASFVSQSFLAAEDKIFYEADFSYCEAVYFVESKLSLKLRSNGHEKTTLRNSDYCKEKLHFLTMLPPMKTSVTY